MTARTTEPLRGLTLLDTLARLTRDAPPDLGYVFLTDGEADQHLSYRALEGRARAVGSLLQQVAAAGERAVLLYPPGLEFLVGFFGSIYGGTIAVPAYAPRINRPDPRLKAIVENSGAAVALTTTAIHDNLDRYLAKLPELRSLRWISTESVPDQPAESWRAPAVGPDTLAVLQYTSGSTGTPRGVMLTHGNLLANLEAMWRVVNVRGARIGVNWLPAFHDMGLIGNLLLAPHVGGKLIMMSPASFVQKPFRWLEAMSRFGAVCTGGPNFAYDLCVRKISAEDRKQLDLSKWEVAFVGSEPISWETIERFAETFAGCGFRREAFLPCFGLAEATLMVSGGRRRGSPILRHVDKQQLEQHRWVPIGSDSKAGRPLVGCGQVVHNSQVRIVDPVTHSECAADQVGEIWVASPANGQGYWQRPLESEATFRARIAGGDDTFYMRTGDLGILDDRELYVTGRMKDVIIIRGRNYYPNDLEKVVGECHPALRLASAAAFSIGADSASKLVVVQEIEREQRKLDVDGVMGAIRLAVSEEFQLEVEAIALLKTGSLPKTSSGKVQRRECQRAYLAGELEFVAHWQRPTAEAPAGPAEGADASGRTLAAAPARSREEIRAWLKSRIAQHARLPLEKVDVGQPFAWYGLDSVTIVSLSAEMESWLGRKLSPTLLFDAPTIETLSAALADPNWEAAAAARGRLPSVGEPIAIIGQSCHFPGADSAAGFWKMLCDGVDGISELPAGRWAGVDPRLTMRQGGFLPRVDLFDTKFWGISPREATQMDPQHRLMLETVWEAIEDAGHAPERLAGKPVGMFLGIANGDYGRLILTGYGVKSAHATTGNAFCMAPNRISYLLDFRGPSVAIDTACSSSLVAVHLACQSIRAGDCDLAVAGGVNLMLSWEVSLALAQARMLSPTGRCRTFDESADGYVRGEGCGAVVLKPLADAVRDRDRISAVIRGTASNQDGRSNGITAPNGLSQVALIRAALRNAGAAPAQIAYVEAHGTGTGLGDPIEFGALKMALGEGSQPCAVGAVKANIGHLEAAAGIAGLIKTALVLAHGEVPPQLHLQELNPHIDLDGSRFHVPTRREALAQSPGPRLAGVSAFGFGGANAHAVLEEPPTPLPRPSPPPARSLHLLLLSAKSDNALRELAGRYLTYFTEQPQASLTDVCFTAAVGRSQLPHRLAVCAGSVEEMQKGLAAHVAGVSAENIHAGCATGDPSSRTAFLFTGQGTHSVGMGRQLYETCPVFRQALERCVAIFQRQFGRSLLEALYPSQRSACLLEETRYVQPALFALEYALTQMWRSWGVSPAAVLGHSLGEYGAACAADVLSLEDALWLVGERARLMHELPDEGEMAAVFAPLETVAQAVAAHPGCLAVAAVNGPCNLVISGKRAAVRAVCRELERDGASISLLTASRAFHSPLLEPMLPAFEKAAAQVGYQPPRLPFITNLSGKVAANEGQSANYWARHAREPVQFQRGLQTLHEQGMELFIEIGPRPLLSALGQTCLPGVGVWLPSLGKGRHDWHSVVNTLAELFVKGLRIDWEAYYRDDAPARVALPTYPFQRQRYWFENRLANGTAPEPAKAPAPGDQVANNHGAPKASNGAQVGSEPLPMTPPGAASVPMAKSTTRLEQLVARLKPAVERLQTQQGPHNWTQLRDDYDRLAGYYVRESLRQLGWEMPAGERVTASGLATRLGVVDRYHRLFLRLLEILAEDGYLRRTAEQWETVGVPPLSRPAPLPAELAARHPEFAAELTLTERCGTQLALVLRGQQEPLTILFPDGSLDLLEKLYQDSLLARLPNLLTAEAVAALAAQHSADRPLRVLEVGAGTGGLTAHVLPRLPARVEYAFTDLSNLFLMQAGKKFSRFPFVRYQRLDIERDPLPQGFAAHQFDLILAANVLHATSNLRTSLRQLRRLLASRGTLLLLEGTGPRRLLDLVFGLTDGWWKFTDLELRPSYPLISTRRWQELLCREGFVDVRVLPPLAEGAADPDQAVILAEGPEVIAPAPSAQQTPPAEGPRQHETIELPRNRLSREALLGVEADQRPGRIEAYLREQLALLLNMPGSEIDFRTPVTAFGLDSLLTIQLKNRIEADLDVTVPIMVFLQGLSLAQIIDKLIANLAEEAPLAPAPETNGSAPPPGRPGQLEMAGALEVDELSEAELDQVLQTLLAAEGGAGNVSDRGVAAH